MGDDNEEKIMLVSLMLVKEMSRFVEDQELWVFSS